MFVRVVVDTGAASPIDFLTYELPDDLAGRVGLGSCVLVPLSSRRAVGFVIGLDEHSPLEDTRPVIAPVESPLRLTQEMVEFARWISERYLCPLSHTILAMLPGAMQCRVQARGSEGSSPKEREWELVPPTGKPRVMLGVRLGDTYRSDSTLADALPTKQAQVVRVMRTLSREPALVELVRRHGLSSAAVMALRRKGILEDTTVTLRRSPEFAHVSERPERLSAEQQHAVDEIIAAMDSGTYRSFLLHGVTASGKTEVYLRCIEHALAKGKTSLVLLPEIAITTQVMNIFKSRFGDAAAVLHSALSAGERCDEWIRAAQGEAKVVVGARSAVFAPLDDIGLIVVDEEQETSYKQDSQPRYHAREAAIERARRSNAALVLGSATPSVETYHRARQGVHSLLEMPSRVENRPLPAVQVVDMRAEYAKGSPTIFSEPLENGIRDRLGRRRQVILLQNRRAFSTFLLCRDCGYVARCPNCAVSLKFHSARRILKCHHCAHELPAPTVCPGCQSLRIKTFGIGTQRVEEEARRAFPEARILRMDRDTTARKGAHAAILSTFRRGDADILVGTQMIAKGLDFPNVTLVGVISADTSLNFPDFSASERTFQLVSQVAGRSGRGREPGEVVIQTFDPQHYAIQSAVNHDYAAFFERELVERREVGYPPFRSIINVLAYDPDETAGARTLASLVEALAKRPKPERQGIEVLGPIPATLSRLRGQYRWHVVLRSADRDRVLGLLRAALAESPNLRRRLHVDVDPVSML